MTIPFKVFLFARRRPDLAHLSHDEFVDFYETKRVPLVRQLIEKGVQTPYLDWRRNYVLPNEAINFNMKSCLDFDMVLEATYKDRDSYETYVRNSLGAAKDALYKDDSQPFDLSSRRTLCVEERAGGIPLVETSDEPFKLFMFTRRRPELRGLSDDEFVEYFETKRVPLIRQTIGDGDGKIAPFVDLRRNYVIRNEPVNQNLMAYMDFDLLLEATYKSRETYEANMKTVRVSLKTIFYKDEPYDSRRYFSVEERTGGVPTLAPN